MPRSTGTSQTQAFDLLATFLDNTSGTPDHTPGLPTAGTLPQFSQRLGGHRTGVTLTSALRSLGQVIFINNPVSGLLLLLALVVQSPAMGLFSALGVVAANLTARTIGCERSARQNGIYGFNGALVGSAAAALASFEAPSNLGAWLLGVAISAALTTVLLQHLGRWLVNRLGVPPLTLPFCLVTWLMLALVMALNHPAMGLLAGETPPAPDAGVAFLVEGVVRGFGQVFLCSSLASGLLVVAAVAAASPLAALIGLSGGLVSSLTALAIGMDPAAVALGLGSYNGVLTAIAIGGTFYASTRGSVLIALLAAAGSSLVSPALAQALALGGLPVLTIPFIVATMGTIVTVRRALPSLLPVALHSVLTPEEHRRRFVVARSLLTDFRRQLGRALSGERQLALLPLADPSRRRQLQTLFEDLDRDGSGSLSVAELATGLTQRQLRQRGEAATPQPTLLLKEVLERMDLDGDGQVNPEEFGELMLRLRRLQEGRERLLTYLGPVDADGNDRLDAAELDRLLVSVGQPHLNDQERQHLFGSTGRGLSWGSFIDRLLLT
jgi:urea transporter